MKFGQGAGQDINTNLPLVMALLGLSGKRPFSAGAL